MARMTGEFIIERFLYHFGALQSTPLKLMTPLASPQGPTATSQSRSKPNTTSEADIVSFHPPECICKWTLLSRNFTSLHVNDVVALTLKGYFRLERSMVNPETLC
jgi:hypothetical protein